MSCVRISMRLSAYQNLLRSFASVCTTWTAARQRQANVHPSRRPPRRGSGPDNAIPARDLAHVVQSEGGHVTLGAATAREQAGVGIMRQRYDRASPQQSLSWRG